MCVYLEKQRARDEYFFRRKKDNDNGKLAATKRYQPTNDKQQISNYLSLEPYPLNQHRQKWRPPKKKMMIMMMKNPGTSKMLSDWYSYFWFNVCLHDYCYG